MNMPSVTNTQSSFLMPLIVRVVIGFALLTGMVAIVATAGWLQYPVRWEPDDRVKVVNGVLRHN